MFNVNCYGLSSYVFTPHYLEDAVYPPGQSIVVRSEDSYGDSTTISPTTISDNKTLDLVSV